MKTKSLVILLLVACVALAVLFFIDHSQNQKVRKEIEDKSAELAKNWQRTSTELTETKKDKVSLETNLVVRAAQVESLSNELVTVAAKLTRTETEAKAAAQAAQEELARRDARINELETQKDDLTKRMGELNVSIDELEKEITDTEKKLSASEGDRAFLLKELKRLQNEKAELERQLNNLTYLREQVKKLRDELTVAKRLEWIRRGIYGSEKGGYRLVQGLAKSTAPTNVPATQTNFNLNVELRQDGSVKVAPVANTNAPATTNVPAAKAATTNAPAAKAVTTNAPAVKTTNSPPTTK
jgi:septal ring factor EnvC (AmiA/AmiB activator)